MYEVIDVVDGISLVTELRKILGYKFTPLLMLIAKSTSGGLIRVDTSKLIC